MKRHIKIYFLPVVAAAALSLGSCGDWTETESVDIRRPSLEAQNPDLYAQYLEALRTYKASDHKVTFVMMENRAGLAPESQNQRLASYPDSVDFICMTNPENLAATYAEDMEKVREKGTRVVYDIDYARFESEWEAFQAAQQPEETPEEGTGEDAGTVQTLAEGDETGEGTGEGAGEEVGTPDEPMTFERFCAGRLESLLACCDAYGFDGICFSYEGRALSGMTQSEIETLTTRLSALFATLSEWRAAHADKLLFFRGTPANLPDGSFLAECSYVIVMAEAAASGEELSIEMLRSCRVEGMPTDRMLIGVTAPALDGADEYGYFSQTDAAGKPLSAMVGAAAWVVAPFEYEIRGVAVARAWNDYYNLDLAYANIREAVNIMNPTPKN